jgi:hypothetical protein
VADCQYVLHRRIDEPVDRVHAASSRSCLARRTWLPLLDSGEVMRVDGPLLPSLHPPTPRTASWCATGQLRGPRGGFIARVEVEIMPWAGYATELTLRPLVIRPGRWRARDARRYFDLASLAADELVVLLGRASRVVEELPERVAVGAA